MPALKLSTQANSHTIVCLHIIQSALSGTHWESGLAEGLVDTVLIEGLAVDTVIGVYDWEREITQRILVDLEMAWDNRAPGASDNVADALDYAAVSERVSECLQTLKPQLLERAAEEIAALLQSEFGVRWLRLTLNKPGAVPAARSVGVRIVRGTRA
jgi:dihydroneopterin aldolase